MSKKRIPDKGRECVYFMQFSFVTKTLSSTEWYPSVLLERTTYAIHPKIHMILSSIATLRSSQIDILHHVSLHTVQKFCYMWHYIQYAT